MEGRALRKHTPIFIVEIQIIGRTLSFFFFDALPVLSITAALSLLEQLSLEAVTPMLYTWLHTRPPSLHVVSLEEHSQRRPSSSVAVA